MADVITVPYSVMADGLELSVTPESPTATVRYKVLWSDVPQFVQDMRGTVAKSGTTKANISRTAPYRFPPSPNLCCVSIDSIEPHGKGYPWFGLMARKWAIVTCQFGFLPYDFEGANAYTSITFGVGGEFMTLPGTTYRFLDGTPTCTPVGRVIAQIEINVKRHQLPYLPVLECATIAGCVNNAPYQIGNYAFNTGTLLFMGGPSEIASDPSGIITNEVEYKFVYRAVPWNFFLYPDRSTGFGLVYDGLGNFVYPPGDFTILP